MDDRFEFLAHSEEDTERLGRALAEAMPGGGIVAMRGTLGAGKTRLVQAIAAAEGVDRRDVVSPTFVLAHEYQGRAKIHHLDAYRLRGDDEFLALGGSEYFLEEGLVLVEWAERIESSLPSERLDVAITETGPTERRFELTAHGARYRAALESVARRLTN